MQCGIERGKDYSCVPWRCQAHICPEWQHFVHYAGRGADARSISGRGKYTLKRTRRDGHLGRETAMGRGEPKHNNLVLQRVVTRNSGLHATLSLLSDSPSMCESGRCLVDFRRFRMRGLRQQGCTDTPDCRSIVRADLCA